MPEPQGVQALPGILATIVASKREELASLRSASRDLARRAAQAPPVRSLAAALSPPGSVSLIAECKRRSPGAGEIRPDLDPVPLTVGYQEAGASALSVLTDERFFGGSTEDLEAVRGAVRIPVLRKDFTLDPIHVVQARAHGADAVLLIVRILGDAELSELLDETSALGMEALVETHDAREVARALQAGARIIGINNRDLATFTTDIGTTLRLLGEIPEDVVVVSESGIRSPDDVKVLGAAGVDSILVGETILRASNPREAAGRLSGVPRGPRSHG